MVDQKGATHLNISHLTLSATGHFVCKTILYPPNESSRKIITEKKNSGEMQKRPKIFFFIIFAFVKHIPNIPIYHSTDIIDYHISLLWSDLSTPFFYYRLHFVRLCIGTINFLSTKFFLLTPNMPSHFLLSKNFFFSFFYIFMYSNKSWQPRVIKNVYLKFTSLYLWEILSYGLGGRTFLYFY